MRNTATGRGNLVRFVVLGGLLTFFLLSALPHRMASAAPLPTEVRIGVLTLFKPKEIQCGGATVTTDGAVREIPPDATWRIALAPGGVALFESSNAKTAAFVGNAIELDGPTVTLSVAGRKTRLTRQFAGRLRVTSDGARLVIVLTQPLEDAVAVMTNSELAGNDNPEAIKAMAVVARSYLAANLKRHAREGFDLCDSTHCQLYYGTSTSVFEEAFDDAPREFSASPLTADAARATRGELLLNAAGRPLAAFTTACCGGRTISPASAFGGASRVSGERGVACDWCRDAKFYRWERSVERGRFLAIFKTEWAAPIPDGLALKVAARTPDGAVAALALSDGRRTVTIPNGRFRHLAGRAIGWNTVLSNFYDIEARGDTLIFRGRGFGHQVGLCVAGATAQARAGRSYREILKYYFPDFEPSKR